jgi:chitin disaccharide deacetylase
MIMPSRDTDRRNASERHFPSGFQEIREIDTVHPKSGPNRGKLVDIIINADDLGYSREINDRIFGLIETRHITSATLITNAPAFEEAAARLVSYPFASFGVHLNVTEFSPLTTSLALEPLLGSNGSFENNKIRMIAISSELREAVYAEWSAQIRRALQCRIPVSHIDSHHHVHTIPSLFFVLKRIQKDFGISKVRRSRNILGLSEKMSYQLRIAKLVWNAALAMWGPTKTTTSFASFQSFHSLLPNRVPRIESIELMCHPGNAGYEAETRLIGGPWRAGLEGAFTLISYNEL